MADDITIITSGSNSNILVSISNNTADPDIGVGIDRLVTSSTNGGKGVDKLSDLLDVDASNIGEGTNKYVLSYDSSTGKYKFINPDQVLDASAGVSTDSTPDPNPQGMSTQTLDYLDVALDNRIDLDGGEF
jgi:hypothetical protein